MSYDINSQQVDIENLFKQNENDLVSIKELYKKLKELEKKISQIKYIDTKLADKLKKDYEKLKRIILDENIQIELNNKIDETKTNLINNINELNSQVDNKINEVNSQLVTKINEVNSQLEQIVQENEKPIGLNKCDEEMLAAIQNKEGETTFNLLSIPRDKSVTPSKTDFIIEKVISNNLFNKNTCTDGFYLDYSSGVERENSVFSYSDFIECVSGNYSMNIGEFQICYYNDSKTFVSGYLTTNGKFTIPNNVSYFRVSIITSMKDVIQINKGDSLLSYDNYKLCLDFTKEINKKYSKLSEIIVVDKNGNGDFTTITSAVENAKDGDVIIVKQGVYRGEVIKAWSKTITINGYDKANTIIVNDTGDYRTPPLEMCSGSLRNLTIIADKNPNGFDGTPAYAIHIENNNMENKTLEIDNCHIISHVNFAIGCGLRKGCLLDIKNSRLEGYSELQGGLYVHDTDVDSMVGLQKLRVKNTEILSNSLNSSAQQLVLQSMHKTGAEFNVEFINVNVRNMVTGNQNPCFQDASDWKAYDRPELVPNITLSKASYGNSIDKLDYI